MRNAIDIGHRFSPLQIGSLTDCVEPLSATSDAEWALETLANTPELEVIPIERDDAVVGLVERGVLEKLAASAWTRFFQKDLDAYMFPARSWVDAGDPVDLVVEKDFSRADDGGRGWYIVQHRRSYLGIASLKSMLLRLNELRAQDLRRAGELQRHLLSKRPAPDHRFSICFYNRMAHEVGGDFYRAAPIGRNRYLASCFDVAGKNISGALATSAIGAFFESLDLFDYDGDPKRTTELLNDLIRRVNPDDVFVAAVLCYIDFDAGELEVHNCGFSPVYLFSPQEEKKVNCRVARPALPPLGIETPEANGAAPLKTAIARGLRLVAYSDGLTDMADPLGERYGEERTTALLRALYKLPQSGLEKAVDAEVDRWIGEAHLADDVTLVDIRFN